LIWVSFLWSSQTLDIEENYSVVQDIVSDMRKVISKHPQVEQRRLHRRAFFDNVDPENQALLILVSCFVKTSHFEEYLRVKEIILLDLLRVISHHNARLATPIRSVQRILDESETRQAPFRDAPRDRKKGVYMIEAAAVAVDDSDEGDIIKVDAGVHTSDTGKENSTKEIGKEDGLKATRSKTVHSPEDAADSKGKNKPKDKAQVIADSSLKSGVSDSADTASPHTTRKPQLEGLDSMGLNSDDITLLKAAFEKPPADIPEGPLGSVPSVDIGQGERASSKIVTEQQKQKVAKADSLSHKVTDETPKELTPTNATEEPMIEQPQDNDPWRQQPQVAPSPQPTVAAASQKSDSGQSGARSLDETLQTAQAPSPSAAPVPRLQSVEENLVLGVALDGPKRTLPLDDDITPPSKPRELVTSRNGGTKEPKDRRDPSSNPKANPSGSTPSE
jgi:hypothetical protein